VRYRTKLPQLDGDLFLTDGGIETTLIFHQGLELPLFAAFDLLKDDEGTEALRRYYEPYAALAKERPRLRPREPDLARQPALGRRARLQR
jgi:homocysteine S-methyltransferase